MIPGRYCNGTAESEEKRRRRDGQKCAEGMDRRISGEEGAGSGFCVECIKSLRKQKSFKGLRG